jgi:hypothetical protein
MFIKTLRYLSLSLVLLLGNSSPLQSTVKSSEETGTLDKMIVANGNVVLDLDLNRLTGTGNRETGAIPGKSKFILHCPRL